MAAKLLILTATDKQGCKITYNVNRFEIYHASGWLMTAAYSIADLKQQIKDNGLVNPIFDSTASRRYLAA